MPEIFKVSETAERLKKIGLRLICGFTISRFSDDEEVFALILSHEQFDAALANINHRLRNDYRVMSTLGCFGVTPEITNKQEAEEYINRVRANHYINHPLARKSATADVAVVKAMAAYLQSPELAEPTIPKFEDLFPKGLLHNDPAAQDTVPRIKDS